MLAKQMQGRLPECGKGETTSGRKQAGAQKRGSALARVGGDRNTLALAEPAVGVRGHSLQAAAVGAGADLGAAERLRQLILAYMGLIQCEL